MAAVSQTDAHTDAQSIAWTDVYIVEMDSLRDVQLDDSFVAVMGRRRCVCE
jgi:predicted protein tyrosine phosphatase